MNEPIQPRTVGACSAEQRLELFAQASRQVAASRDLAATLENIIQCCLPLIADFGFFDARVDDDTVVRTARAYEDPELEAILRPTQWVRQEPGDMNLCALSSGEPCLHTEIDDAWYRRVAQGPEHLEILRTLAFRSMISVPLRFGDELLGALTLFMGKSGRHHTTEDLHFASQLAGLSAPLLANARLLDAQQRAERALRIGEERLRLATEAGQLGIWDWRVGTDEISWTRRVYELHGLEPQESAGGVKEFKSLVHPDDLPYIAQRLEATLNLGEPYEIEFRTIWPDGSIRWLAAKADLYRNAQGAPERLIGATWDVTERIDLLAAEREARAVAQAASRNLAVLARASEELSKSLNRDDTLRAIAAVVVPRIADWCRIDLVDASGELVHALSHHSDPELARRGSAIAKRWRAPAEMPNSLGWVVATRNHALIEISAEDLQKIPDPEMAAFAREIGLSAMLSVPLIARDRVIGALTALHARQDRRFDEEDRSLMVQLGQRAAAALDNAQLYTDAQQARQDAEEASRAKDEFLAVLGHELRNPLAPIVTALHLMRMRGDTGTKREQEIIQRQVAHMSRLVDDLLDISRITRGKVEFNCKSLKLHDVLAQAVDQVQGALNQRRQKLELKAGAETANVFVDEVRLVQVFSNLLVNASKFSPPESKVVLTTSHVDEQVLVSIEDEGIGISSELLPKIFDLFVQGPQASDRGSGGLGIGLTLVDSLVRLQGGKVWAESDGPGKGSRFHVLLPLAKSQRIPALSDEDFPLGERLQGKVLVVDDNIDAGETICALLRSYGLETQYVTNGDDALLAVETFTPSVALLDIGLPGMDGYALAQALHDQPGLKDLRAIAVTGYGEPADRVRTHRAGFVEHLVKPVMPTALMSAVTKHLG